MQTSDRELASLFSAVVATPDDDAPRLVLADALEERGDPRGRFISLQVRRVRGAGGGASRGGRVRRQPGLAPVIDGGP
jgi:uncharacterized protein (TIGR02996 family)